MILQPKGCTEEIRKIVVPLTTVDPKVRKRAARLSILKRPPKEAVIRYDSNATEVHTTYAGFMSANRTSYECVSQEQPMYMVKITKTVLGENVEFEVQDAARASYPMKPQDLPRPRGQLPHETAGFTKAPGPPTRMTVITTA